MSSVDVTATPIRKHGEQSLTTTGKDRDLSTRRLNVMPIGYAFMGIGRAIIKWSLLFHARSLP